MKAQAIIPAAGVGKRFKSRISKPLVIVKGKPVIIYTLKAFEDCSLIKSVILVGNKKNLEALRKVVKKFHLKKVIRIIPGGATRTQSIAQGLKILDEDTRIVIVHDGVRPLVSVKLLKEATRQCQAHRAVTVAVPVKPTIKKVDKRTQVIKETLNRDELWEVQTPQVFRKEILLKAYAKNKNGNATDDASLVERLGVPVKIVTGDYKNIKVTTTEDLVIMKAFLNCRN